MHRLILSALILLAGTTAFSQVIDDVAELVNPPDIDSTFVDLNDNLWTLRLFTSVKYQSFSLKNNSGRVFYRPTEPVSGGIGASYKTLMLDLGIRFSNEGSQRFDLQTSALYKSYFINLNIQNYKGFEETDPEQTNNFREDIRTLTVNLDVMYLPNHRQISFRTIQSGIDRQKVGSGSILVGGFIGYHRMQADSSIIPVYAEPSFTDDYALNELVVRSLGVAAGYMYIHPLTNVMYLAGSIRPGFGLQWGRTETLEKSTNLPGGLFSKVSFTVGTGFNWAKFYASAVYHVEASYVNLRNDHVYNYNSGKLKAVFGYKL
jgi:hypothetical protein